MKFFVIIQLICLAILGYSQPQDSLIKNYKLNFALPDFPAFKALGSEPSNLLRPSSVQEFGFVASEFFNGKNLVIPNSFGTEISPIILMNVNKMTLSEYQTNSSWKTSRFSIGAQRDSLNTSKLAIGYRISLINEGDLRTDNEYLKKIFAVLEKRTKVKGQLRTEYLNINRLTAADLFIDSIRIAAENYVNEKSATALIEFDEEITKLKKTYKEEKWNAKKLDVAIAVVGQSPDSLLEKVDFNSLSLWITYGAPMFNKKAQFVMGLNYRNYISNEENFHSISLSNRNYIGTNRIKGFLEEQIGYDQLLDGMNILLNLGAELNLNNGLWIDLSAGLTKDFENKSSNLVSQFRFKYTLPEKSL